jgi:hypothetical protein
MATSLGFLPACEGSFPLTLFFISFYSFGTSPCSLVEYRSCARPREKAMAQGRSNIPSILLAILILLIPHAQPQAVDRDNIDFSTYPGIKDLRVCVRDSVLGGVSWATGCSTNTCLCRPSTLGGVIPFLKDKALSACNNLDDQSTAVSVVTPIAQ